jgi:hypothetical protein
MRRFILTGKTNNVISPFVDIEKGGKGEIEIETKHDNANNIKTKYKDGCCFEFKSIFF